MTLRPEQEMGLQGVIDRMRSREEDLSDELTSGEGSFWKKFRLLQRLRSAITQLSDEIPSSGPSGPISDGTKHASRGPDPHR